VLAENPSKALEAINSFTLLAADWPEIGITEEVTSTSPPVAVGPTVVTPPGLRLSAPTPNPFRAAVEVRFPGAVSGPIAVTVHDVAGRLVRTLVDGARPAGGLTRLSWDGADAHGRPAAPGVYFFRARAGRDVRTVQATKLR